MRLFPSLSLSHSVVTTGSSRFFFYFFPTSFKVGLGCLVSHHFWFDLRFVSIFGFQGTMHKWMGMQHWKPAFISAFLFTCIACLHATEQLRCEVHCTEHLTKILSVIRNQKYFQSLITGKTSVYTNTKVLFAIIWQPPALPCRLQHSTIGRLSLNHRVRDGNGCVP